MNPQDPVKRLSNSDPAPSPFAQAGKRISGILRGRRVSSEPVVSDQLAGLTVRDNHEVVSPRFSKSYGKTHAVHTDVILSLLDSTQAGASFVDKLFKKFSELLNAEKKPLKNAACDLWRSMSKVKIIANDECVLDVRKESYNDLEPEDVPDLNSRFLRILGYLPSVSLPQEVYWKGTEGVANWVEQQESQGRVNQLLARFIRSWSQDRYTGVLVDDLLAGFGHNPDSIPPPPIIAELQQKLRVHTCVFNEDGSHTEILKLPIRIVDRETRDQALEWLDWILEFHYDSNCLLTKIISKANKKQKANR